jgi:hypothetical protein
MAEQPTSNYQPDYVKISRYTSPDAKPDNAVALTPEDYAEIAKLNADTLGCIQEQKKDPNFVVLKFDPQSADVGFKNSPIKTRKEAVEKLVEAISKKGFRARLVNLEDMSEIV